MSGQAARARRLMERLSVRDISVLVSLRELRLLSGNQLGRWHVDGTQPPATHTRKTRAVLQRLTELGLIVRLRRRIGGVRSGSHGYVYGLSGLGQAVLDVGREVPSRHRRVRDTKPAFQRHTLAVSEICVQLVEHCRAGEADLLEFAGEPRAWRRFPGLAGQTVILKPDGFVRLGIDGYEVSGFLEIDLDTESLPTIARKLAVYVAYWRSGTEDRQHGVFPRVWWLVPNTVRAQAIARTIARLPEEARPLFAVCLLADFTRLITHRPTEGGAR